MTELPSPPNPRLLLQPLLACLPTASVSPRPPPALLPLLSPILRQRVQILTSLSTSNESWLRLLCWDNAKAERLQTLIDGANFEPHPSSGEIELSDDLPVSYKRIDDETLRSQVLVTEFNLVVIYLWCPTDDTGGGPAWRIAELLPHDDPVDEPEWAPTMSDANIQTNTKIQESSVQATGSEPEQVKESNDQEQQDDDDYWAQYDATPSRTPGPGASTPNKSAGPAGQSEASYFSQYGDVQPAMDSHDPSEEQSEIGPSSLGGDMLASLLRKQINGLDEQEKPRTNGYASGDMLNTEGARRLSHPRPESASSNNSAVAKLEDKAESQSNHEVGVKQHIGTSIKSLFRLAKASGISRNEFESMVQVELELLKVTDQD
ncbi:hypothetical protein N7495_003136 [Penicillium taxi]|uniref:uncharacterized protein n=1 Tax=Penicillium taxi TaxID=168475 RepID=UPI0025451BCB|nr:uncharacterized protein N7495_003136 [Penicillium taxi]KAJ5902608.1 hypothetical protein N7495_003136 [Penicillium taxi]